MTAPVPPTDATAPEGRLTPASEAVVPFADELIGVEDARRAAYIDFEGRKNEDPVLLGVLYGIGATYGSLKLRNYILDPGFFSIAGQYKVPGLQFETRCQSFKQACNVIIRLALKQQRLIVSWSRHDAGVVQRARLDKVCTEGFPAIYRDGKTTAKTWAKVAHPDVLIKRGEHSLQAYMDLVGYKLPDDAYGPGRTGENLKGVREGLARHGSWTQLSDRQRGAWLEVVGHNLHDCRALREIVTHAAAHEAATA